MSDLESSPSLLDQLAEDFVRRIRLGQVPELSEYEAMHPEVAQGLRELLPALLVMEQLKPNFKTNVENDPSAITSEIEELGKLGDYAIVRQIGRGGMGIVYEAIQQSLGRRVALKVLPKQLVGDRSRQARFEREARSAAALHHTNIVPVFGVGSENELHYYAMQYIEGLGLDEVLIELKRLNTESMDKSGELNVPAAKLPSWRSAREQLSFTLTQGLLSGPVPTCPKENARQIATGDSTGDSTRRVADPSQSSSEAALRDTDARRSTEASAMGTSTLPLPGLSECRRGTRGSHYWQSVAQIGIQVAEAVHYAHDQGILHRDIKPSNLILDTRGNVWVTDFGLAKVEDQQDLTHSGDVLGTLRYMAPETFNGKSDRRSDLYSLGLTIYELLALSPGFQELDRGRLIRMVLHESPPRLRTLDPRIPVDLETIVHKAIDRDPNQRYETAQAFADDLLRFVNDEPIRARRTSLLKRVERWCRKNPGIAALSWLMLAALCTLAVSQWQVIEQRNRYRQSLQTALIAQSRFQRLTNEVGHRTESLSNLARAAELGSSQLIREEAIRAMVLTDLREVAAHPVKFLSYAGDSVAVTSDGSAHVSYEMGRVTIRSLVRSDRPELVPAGAATLWSAATNGDGPHTAKFSPCGNFIAVCFDSDSRGQSLRLWKWRDSPSAASVAAIDKLLPSAEPIRLIDGVIDRAYDIDGRGGRLLVATSTEAAQKEWSLQCLDIVSGDRLWQLTLPGQPFELRLDASAQMAAVTVPDAECVLIVNAQSGQMIHDLNYHQDIYSIAWSPDSQAIAVGLGFDVAITYLDEPTMPRMRFDKGHTWMVHRLEYQPEGNLLASYSLREGTSRIWDLRRRAESLLVNGCVLGFSSDSTHAFVLRGSSLLEMQVQSDDPYGVMAATDGDAWEAWRLIPHPKEPIVMTCGVEGLTAWSVESPRRLVRIREESLHTLHFDPNTMELVTAGDGGTRRRRIHMETPDDLTIESPSLFEFGRRTEEICSQASQACCVSRAGNRAAILLRHGSTIVVYDAESETYRELSVTTHTSFLALSPDGRWLVAGNYERPGFLCWDLETDGRPVDLEVIGSGAQPLFSPDGKYLVACTNDRYSLFDVGAWKHRHTWKHGHRVEGAAAFNARGDVLALSMGPGSVSLVEPASGSELLRLNGELDPVNILNLQFASDAQGERLYLCCGRSGIRYWDLTGLRRTLSELGL